MKKQMILVECLLLIDLVKSYIATEALESERLSDSSDQPTDSTCPISQLNEMLNEYLAGYTTDPEYRSAIDEDDKVLVLIDEIVTDIVEHFPDAQQLTINAGATNSLFVLIGTDEEEVNLEEDDGDV